MEWEWENKEGELVRWRECVCVRESVRVSLCWLVLGLQLSKGLEIRDELVGEREGAVARLWLLRRLRAGEEERDW